MLSKDEDLNRMLAKKIIELGTLRRTSKIIKAKFFYDGKSIPFEDERESLLPFIANTLEDDSFFIKG